MYRALGNYLLQQARYTDIGRAVWARLRQHPAIENWAQSALAKLEGPPRDLDAIASLTLPENFAFVRALPQINEIEGMFSHFSMAVIDALLSYQNASGIHGDMLEFGVFKGKSAALIGRHLKPSEHLLLVDMADLLNRDAIAPFQSAVTYMLCGTENFSKRYTAYGRKRGAFRFIHIDASHNFRPTFRELKMADELLAHDGIIAMDDFANLNYSQNMAAIFKYLFTTRTDLTVFLATDEKAYLCRRSAFAKYSSFLLDRILAEVASRRVPSCLGRTDRDPDYRPFYLRPRYATEHDSFYGVEIYRRLYQWI